MIYFKEEFATIYIEEAQSLIHIEWNGPVNSPDYRITLEIALELAKEKKLTCWLANMQYIGTVAISDHAWTKDEWFPKFLETTMKKAALIVSKDRYSQLAVQETIEEKKLCKKMQYQEFTELQSAKAWLGN